MNMNEYIAFRSVMNRDLCNAIQSEDKETVLNVLERLDGQGEYKEVEFDLQAIKIEYSELIEDVTAFL